MPERKNYIEHQKTEYGRKLLGVFPAHYPKEILWALNILPVEIWDPPIQTSRAGAHLQPYICSVVKLGLELILQNKCQVLDGFLFPHTCDSIQNLSSIVNDYLSIDTPCFFFYHPKAPYHESSRRYYRKQLDHLKFRLESHFGPLDTKQLKHSIQQSRKIAILLNKLYALRAAMQLDVSNHDFYTMVRQGEFLHPDDYIFRLTEFLSASKGVTDLNGPSILLSGIVPTPSELLPLLDQLSVQVVNDDYLCCQRRIASSFPDDEDPFETLTASYFSMPPCSTKNSSLADRLNYILKMAETGGAKGIIFNLIKFCEPELFDIPQLVKGLKAAGLATLTLDSDINQGMSGQLVTRVEAFIEMIN